MKSNSGGTAPCWARVIVRGLRTAIRAKVDLKPGHIIRSNEIEQVQVPYCPLRHIPVESLTGYIGMMVRRPLRTGDILAPSQVVAAPIIARGSTIPVLVISGGAQLRFEARADTDGRTGQPITLTNLRSRRHFVGIVRIDGSVVVHSRFGSRSDRL